MPVIPGYDADGWCAADYLCPSCYHLIPNIYHTLIPVQESFCQIAHLYKKKKSNDISPNISGRAVGWNAETLALVRWMMSALTERSFPAHLHSSLLVEDAGQGICNKDKTHFLFMRKNPVHESVLGCESIQLRPACAQLACVRAARMRTRGLKRSRCDLLSTLF